MMKRIGIFVVALSLVTALLAMNTSAAGIVYKEDFNNPPESGVVNDMEGWKNYDAARKDGASFEDGAVRLGRYAEGSTSGYALYDINYNVGNTSDHVITFDLKMTGGIFNLAGWFYMGTSRISLPGALDDDMEVDKWYTFVFQAVNGADGTQTANLYRKGPWNSEDEKAACEYEKIGSLGGSANAQVAHINIGANNAPIGGALYIDNFEVAEGEFIHDVTFKADGDEIEAAEELSGATELEAEMIVFSGKNLTPELDATQDVFPVLLMFDEEGRMLDCQMSENTIGKFYNTVTLTADISNISDDIHSIQYCLWDSIFDIQPLFDCVELN